MNDPTTAADLDIHLASGDCPAFEARLRALEGIGPKTVEILLRDARAVLF
ncbi:hypothetical protein [Pseudomonas eucalypticola]|uniref:Uncharacterized protein n=1 Tax=Pseudomonas eucalypticola TaxID=2599595 RepID=A0A7D5D736_9PSED|nr:hypothetical protein [Pseudomonas eucalypticola]QKZ04376.1 hypothetical protein HWQ56_11485 [Pseudomonas eucalypticola]